MHSSRILPVVALLFGMLVVGLSAQTPPANFKKPVLYPSGGTSARAVTVADVNGDNHPDLVLATGCVDNSCVNGAVSILLANTSGNGTFQPALVLPSGGAGALAVAVADVNHDTKPDVVVANACVSNADCTDGTIGVLLGNGNGTFQSPISYSTGGPVYGMALADVNRDGKLDAVVGTSNGVGSLLGNDDGTFHAPVISATGGFGALAVDDLNGDDTPDAVVIISSGSRFHPRVNGQIGVAFGNGNGTFKAPLVLDSIGFFPDGLAIGDINDNGFPDILVSNKNSHINDNSGVVGLWYGDGHGHFGPGVEARVGGLHAYSVTAGDVNLDGVDDMVVSEDGNASVVLTNGQTRHHRVHTSNAIAIADVNGDGQPDLLVAGSCDGIGCRGPVAAVFISQADPTETTVTTSGSPSQINQPVTFTAHITSKRGPVADGKTVTFFDGTKQIGTGTTSNGVATFTTSSLKAGTHTIKANFSGYTFFKPSTGTVKQVVNP